jgi:hypothetical protein
MSPRHLLSCVLTLTVAQSVAASDRPLPAGAGATSTNARPAGACRPGGAVPAVWSGERAVSVPARAPCRILLVPQVTLRTSDANGVSDIGQRAARDSRGVIYTYTTHGTITRWSADGRVLGEIGREGSGPGEFPRGPITLHVGRGDSLFAHGAGDRWTVFSPAGMLARTFSDGGVGAFPGTSLFLQDGTYLTAQRRAATGTGAFTIVQFGSQGANARGFRVLRNFGARPGSATAAEPSGEQMVSYGGGETFWSLDPDDRQGGYVLREWSLTGQNRRSLRRAVPWLRPTGNPRGREGSPSPPPEPRASRIHVDSSGLAFVAYYRATPQWRPGRTRAEREQAEEQHMEMWLDVIDTRTATLVALFGPMPLGRARVEMPLLFFPRSTDAYFRENAADGHRLLRISRISLEPAR